MRATDEMRFSIDHHLPPGKVNELGMLMFEGPGAYGIIFHDQSIIPADQLGGTTVGFRELYDMLDRLGLNNFTTRRFEEGKERFIGIYGRDGR